MELLLYQTPSNKLDAYITDHLLPSREFQENVQDAVHRICSFLKERCSMDARVIKTIKGGSAGKGTTLDDNSDADLVIFLSCFSSYQDQAQKRASVISTIEKNLLQCCESLAFKIDILPPRIKGEMTFSLSLSLTMQSRKKKEAVEVDILPAFDVLGQITLSFTLQERYKPPPKVYIDLIHAGGKPGEFNTSFTELQRNFVKHCPAKVKGLLRLVKHWYKDYKKGLRERDPSVSLPPKFALELLAIYAWEEGTGRKEQFNTAEGFCTVMKLLVQYEELCIY
ncbi:LOW QUALITY PROTEIN: 2'-5'-oligoadenylate synthase-like protein 2 [Sceloporus undulatus]|uniref:LOW QUALITY PROTEIN: 2'-5'-oligoadenylate synthase-like protein 2 n=1 Tax=Sceloporus undulatus TaxID=8520 RepID=UPI001C4B3761|nr:LOW QUALITY PROTEIN: 2'-5'-oligoadenylate synthase-like protein 2 [Sceloporus undulatus]